MVRSCSSCFTVSRSSTRAGARGDLKQLYRIGAELQQIVIDAHPLKAQHFSPDLRQGLFNRAPGCNVLIGPR